MSGAIVGGIQYERCNHCGKMVRMTLMISEKPSEMYPFGRDLCKSCFEAVVEADLKVGFTILKDQTSIQAYQMICIHAGVSVNWRTWDERDLDFFEGELDRALASKLISQSLFQDISDQLGVE